MIPVREHSDRTGLIHIATQTEHEFMSCVYYIACQGEDTAIAWVGCGDATPTCFACVAAGFR